jgi:glucokinase
LPVEKGAENVQRQLVEGITQLLLQANTPVLGVGIGVAAQIDRSTGTVIFAPNLNWHQVPLKSYLETMLKLPVNIDNDVRVITYGEWLYGAGKGCQHLVCLFVGTGIGSGVVINGELISGFSNTFGEVGHLSVDFKGPKCTCGNLGCMEAFAGGWGIAARAKELITQSPKELAQPLLALAAANGNVFSAKIVVDAYHRGDKLAGQVIAQAKQALVIGCAGVVNVLNPQRLILGGGVVDGLPELVADVDQGVRQYALKAATNKLEVVSASLTKEAGVVGSAAMLFH